LKFISDEKLFLAVEKVIDEIESAKKRIDTKLYKNVLDPFSALFDGITHKISYEEWLKSEKARQVQKTMQNAIGNFHQDILGSIAGFENLGVGQGVDICNRKTRLIAEIKNKFNTTKGNHKVEIYDSLKAKLNTKEFNGFTGYYVEVIPPNRKSYDHPFTPSDNKSKTARPKNEFIRIIDGVSFYGMVTGRPNALKELFEILPLFISDHFPYLMDKHEVYKYLELYGKAFTIK